MEERLQGLDFPAKKGEPAKQSKEVRQEIEIKVIKLTPVAEITYSKKDSISPNGGDAAWGPNMSENDK